MDQRSYFQLERDQVESLLQLERQYRGDLESRVRLLEKQKEDSETRHQVEIKVCAPVGKVPFSLVLTQDIAGLSAKSQAFDVRALQHGDIDQERG